MLRRRRGLGKLIKDMKKPEGEQKERLLDLQCKQMRESLIFCDTTDDKDESYHV